MNTRTKIALITGGSRGLGKNMALAIARKGLDVMITYNIQVPLKPILAGSHP